MISYPLKCVASLVSMDIMESIEVIKLYKRTIKRSHSFFLNVLASVFKQIIEKLVKPNYIYQKYLTNPNTNVFFSKELIWVIKELSNNKSTGRASIPSKFYKLFQIALSKPISLIANLSFSSENFPDYLKIANEIPIFKKDERTICNNYRPISLPSNISKIIEKLIHTVFHCF